jgi:hypothetical protein
LAKRWLSGAEANSSSYHSPTTMASIILSFVGQQDPFAKTETEGSIVTLVRHLIASQHTVKRVFLLHTDGTQQNAIDTKTWLTTAPVNLPEAAIAILPVAEDLSHDPVNLLLAAQEARKGIEAATPYLDSGDTLEFNASSGTPVMKSAWSILQAAGYAPRSHIWQVRNPQQMQPGQDHVFQTNVNTFKDEFDLKVMKQQVQDYNYSGALITLKQSHLHTDAIETLLNYGYYRISMDFDRAFSCLNAHPLDINPQWTQEIAPLRQKDPRSLLQEAYFNALIRLKTQKYADFLVGLFKLQEQTLYYLVQAKLSLNISGKPTEQRQSWQVIQQVDQGKLYQFLQTYKLPKGDFLIVNRAISRYVLQAIVEYHHQFASILPLIQSLNQYCELRNEYVHGFAGVSQIEDEATLLTTLRILMQQTCGIPTTNPFDRLNQEICDRLNHAIQSPPEIAG